MGHTVGNRRVQGGLQTVLNVLYPPSCAGCDALIEGAGGLCGPCWREANFISGLVCDKCGAPLPGEDAGPQVCDDCLTIARPWDQGRSALVYRGTGRKLILALKHGDRTDLAPLAGRWLLQAARPLLRPDTLIAPVPLHWTRFLKRRFNQSALLAQNLGRRAGAEVCPDLLCRHSRTRSLEGLTRDQRFACLQDAIRLTPRQTRRLEGRSVLLIDDVMTSGATLAAAAEACQAGRPREIYVLTLARVVKDA